MKEYELPPAIQRAMERDPAYQCLHQWRPWRNGKRECRLCLKMEDPHGSNIKRLAEDPVAMAQFCAPAHTAGKPIRNRASKGERAIHDEIEQFLRLRGWYYVHSRMDKPTTCAVGTPDFIVCMPDRNGCGIFVAIECKLPGEKTSTDQEEHIERIIDNDGEARVCYSSKEAIDWLLELEKL